MLVQNIADLAWALCDVAILVCWFRYGRQYLPEKAQNVAMSVLFLAALFQRDSTKGFSLLGAVCKCIGTLTPTIWGCVERGGIHPYIFITGTMCFVLDLIYIHFFSLKKQETASLLSPGSSAQS